MYQKKNTLVNTIRGYQTHYGITELTVFDRDEFDSLKVCFSGLLDDFNAVGKLDVGLVVYRQNLLKRRVKEKVVFHDKLFVWLDKEP